MAKFTLNLAGPSIKIPNSLSESPFDYIGRYQLTAEIISKYFSDPPQAKLSILDVGGSGGPLQKILPEASVMILDSEATTSDRNIILGDGTNMTDIANDTYDAVITCDTLEHIPKDKRSNFVSELNRVSKDLVVLCAPHASKSIINAELETQKVHNSFYGEQHRWLDEHSKYQLPKAKEVESYFKSSKVNLLSFTHGSLNLWQRLIKLNLLANVIDDDDVRSKIKKINRYYNRELLFKDFNETGYRIFAIASKSSVISWHDSEKHISSDEYLEIAQMTEDLYTSIILQAGKIPSINKRLSSAHQSINDLNGELENLNRKYSKVIHSKSWRYTSALRGVRRLLR